MKKIGLIVLIVFGIWLFFESGTKFWNSGDKLSLVIQREDGGVSITTFDSSSQSVTTIQIPGETQVEVARNLGSWKLKSLWQLAANEKTDGSLLAKTIVKNFNFPTFAWADSGGQGFSQNNLGSLVKAVFSAYKTNLGRGDKVKIALFLMQVKNTGREEIDLTQTPLLKRIRLKDGEMGYLVTENVLKDVLPVFSDPIIGSKDFKVKIVDLTQKGRVIQNVAKTIEILGPKVASVVKESPDESDCEISGSDRRFVAKVARVFDCRILISQPDNFDLVIKIGENFAKRF